MLAERPSAPSAGPVELRLTLSLSGGASLGAYQAGACAALLTGIGHLRDEAGVDVRLDAVGGASAGAIVAVMAAHSVLEGLDAAAVMRSAWVERVSLDTLLRGGSRGPLSLEKVRQDLPGLLDDAEHTYEGQPHPLMLHIALTGLRGLTYEIAGLRSSEQLVGVTYADWKDFRLEPGRGVRQLVEPAGASPLEKRWPRRRIPGRSPRGFLTAVVTGTATRHRACRTCPPRAGSGTPTAGWCSTSRWAGSWPRHAWLTTGMTAHTVSR